MKEFILNLNANKKPLIVSLSILVLTFMLGYNFLYSANIKKCNQLKIKIQDAKNINMMLAELNTLRSGLRVYSEKHFDAPDPNSVMARVTDIAAGCNIKIETVAVGKRTAENGYSLLPCKVTFSAPYYKLRLFLNKLEMDKKFLKIDSLSVTPVKVVRKLPLESGPAVSGAGEVTEVFKMNKQDGMWVNVNMDICGFHAE